MTSKKLEQNPAGRRRRALKKGNTQNKDIVLVKKKHENVRIDKVMAPPRTLINASHNLKVNFDDDVKHAERYAKCLIFPYDNATYLPDDSTLKSTVFKTKRVFQVQVPVDSTAAGEAVGSFAFFVQPKIGSLAFPEGYQIGVLKMDNGVPHDIRRAGAYHEHGTANTTLALDTNASTLTQPRPSCVAIQTLTAAAGRPLVGAADWRPYNNQPFTFNSRYSILETSTIADASELDLGVSGSFTIQVFCTTATAPPADANEPTPFFVRTRVAGQAGMSTDFITILTQGGSGLVNQSVSYSVSLNAGDTIVFQRKPGVTTSISSLRVLVTPLFSPSYNLTENYGIVEKIRPVGMSVLTTCILPSITASGTISTVLSVAGAEDKVFGNAKNWCNTEALSVWPECYTGPLAKGSYGWWKPASVEDRVFRSIDDANKYEYPMILVAGALGAGSIPDTGSVVHPVQVTVEFVYEVSHETQLFDTRKYTGSPIIVSKAIQAIGRLKSVTENPKHSSLLKDLSSVMHETGKFLPFASQLVSLFG